MTPSTLKSRAKNASTPHASAPSLSHAASPSAPACAAPSAKKATPPTRTCASSKPSIITTGGKATDVLLGFTGDAKTQLKTGETLTFRLDDRELSLTRLPSTSRAYPLKLAQKIAAYRAFFQRCGLV